MVAYNRYAYVRNNPLKYTDPSSFWSGFTSSALSPLTGSAGTFEDKIAMSAVVGGTAGELGGGKFANGAVSAAFVMMFNEMGHPKIKSLFDFIKHYFEDGTPRYVTDEYILSESVQGKISSFENKALSFAKQNGTFFGWTRKSTDVTWESLYLFSIGHSGNSLGIGYKGLWLSASCSDGRCFFTYDLYDSFRDPLDIGISLPHSEPYAIYGHWTKEIDY